MKSFLSILSAAALCCLFFTACSHHIVQPLEHTTIDEQVPAAGPGRFGMSHLKGLSKSEALTRVLSEEMASFNLGEIKSSSAFYFLLYNIGKTPITNVTLRMADTNFSVHPATMDTLVPGEDVGLLPVVKVSAYHGTAMDGVGFRPLMPMGANEAALVVSGTTKTQDGTDTTVMLSVGMNVTALIMDFSFQVGNAVVDLRESDTSYMQTAGESVFFKNTGNVPIAASMVYHIFYGEKWDTLQSVIAVGDSVAFARHRTLGMVAYLDGDKTPSRLLNLLEPDGRARVRVSSGKTLSWALDLAMYIEVLADTGSACADQSDRAFLIDDTYLFHERRGTCVNDKFFYGLYMESSENLYSIAVAGTYQDSDTGAVEQSLSTEYGMLLTTMRQHLDEQRLGLDTTHIVEAVMVDSIAR